MNERLPYSAPAEPVVVGAVEASEGSYYGGSSDFSVYSSVPLT